MVTGANPQQISQQIANQPRANQPRTIQLKYFAWVRERIGRADEQVELPPTVLTIADLVAWLTTRGPEYAQAFDKPEIVRAAIDQAHVKPTAALNNAREIAFFPPVTGG